VQSINNNLEFHVSGILIKDVFKSRILKQSSVGNTIGTNVCLVNSVFIQEGNVYLIQKKIVIILSTKITVTSIKRDYLVYGMMISLKKNAKDLLNVQIFLMLPIDHYTHPLVLVL